ncbi:MAG: DMT family transporter [Ruminococcus sp.]|nr:DMT family transporter [Ruminococcus sp.]
MANKLKGNAILLLTAIIWGTSFVAQSEGMKYIEPFTYNSLRTIIGGIVLVPVIAGFRIFDRKKENKKYSLRVTLIGGLVCGTALCVASSLQQFGIVYTTAGKSGFITALYVIIVPFYQLVLGRKPRPIVWFCVLGAVVGFYLLCIKDDFTVGLGDLLTLICAFIFALHIIFVDRFLERGANGLEMACVQFFTAGLIMLVGMFVFEHPQLDKIWVAKYTILYAGVLSCGVAYTLQIIGQRYAEPTIATLLMSLESVFAVLSGWIILGEVLTVREFIGCCLVFAAVVFSQIKLPSRKNKLKTNGGTK